MPFEGWLVRRDGVWMVRGYEHPPGKLIVVPYRVPASQTKGQERRKYLECVGRSAFVVDRERADLVDPAEALKRAPLPAQARELLDLIAPSWAGLTGSYALGLQRPDSDVDLLAYTSRPHEVYRALADLREEGLVSDCRQDVRFEKERDSFTYSEFALLHPLKLLDSCFRRMPYTLRLLRFVEEMPCQSRFSPIGWVEFIGEVRGGEPYLTPAIYNVKADGMGDVLLMTWRTRYQELPEGRYLIRGLLQRDEVKGQLYVVPDLGGRVRPIEVRAR